MANGSRRPGQPDREPTTGPSRRPAGRPGPATPRRSRRAPRPGTRAPTGPGPCDSMAKTGSSCSASSNGPPAYIAMPQNTALPSSTATTHRSRRWASPNTRPATASSATATPAYEIDSIGFRGPSHPVAAVPYASGTSIVTSDPSVSKSAGVWLAVADERPAPAGGGTAAPAPRRAARRARRRRRSAPRRRACVAGRPRSAVHQPHQHVRGRRSRACTRRRTGTRSSTIAALTTAEQRDVAGRRGPARAARPPRTAPGSARRPWPAASSSRRRETRTWRTRARRPARRTGQARVGGRTGTCRRSRSPGRAASGTPGASQGGSSERRQRAVGDERPEARRGAELLPAGLQARPLCDVAGPAAGWRLGDARDDGVDRVADVRVLRREPRARPAPTRAPPCRRRRCWRRPVWPIRD